LASDKRKQAVLAKLADHILEHGIGAASLRQLAQGAGTSDRMLLYYFTDKDELIREALLLIAARLTMMLEAGRAPHPEPVEIVMAHMLAMSDLPALWPYQRLFLEIAARAAQGDPLCAAVGEALGREFLAWGEAQIAESDPEARAAAAAKLLLIVEGSVFLRAIGLADVTRRALGSEAPD
jgi:AcrR family transcriptional regulator